MPIFRPAFVDEAPTGWVAVVDLLPSRYRGFGTRRTNNTSTPEDHYAASIGDAVLSELTQAIAMELLASLEEDTGTKAAWARSTIDLAIDTTRH